MKFHWSSERPKCAGTTVHFPTIGILAIVLLIAELVTMALTARVERAEKSYQATKARYDATVKAESLTSKR